MHSESGTRPGRTATAARRHRRTRVALGAAVALAAINPLMFSGVAGAATPAGTAAPAYQAQDTTPATEHWTTQTVAPGVQVRTGVIERAGAAPTWTVTVQAPAVNRLTGAATWSDVGSQAWAETTAQQLRDAGFQPVAQQVSWPDYADTPDGTMGWRVRVGSYAAQAEAQSASQKVNAAGLRSVAAWSGYDADQPADRESIHVAVIDPRTFDGTVEGTHNGNVAQREKTSAVAAQLGSLVAVNGGFFITSDADGVQGTPAGAAAYDGTLEAMAGGTRAALILEDGGRHPRIADVSTEVTVRAGSSTYAVEGINRVPGKVRNCGRPGATPTEQPRQDLTCNKTDDLVRFTSLFGASLPAGPGTQAVLDATGRVISSGARGGTVPAGGSVLQGIGSAGDWLADHARQGERITVKEVVRDTEGRRVELGPDDSMVSAAPTLVKDGRIDIDAAGEGTLDPQDLSFGYAWSNVRQPRTMAGIDKRGRLLLVTVDGRQPGVSEGLTLAEAASFMRSLGAVDALNLDGGGSTAMAVGGTLVNTTSDATGERPVGDTVQVLPAGRD
ncbi:phosphodiester glycosidase family protein [Streptomyces sp. NPDC002896]|uniref:phosphodiester glycosidase family protein n=1 Tax=Streptomyces sp. NPDC002896 TaxID=3154438 RepID=UPI003330CCFA